MTANRIKALACSLLLTALPVSADIAGSIEKDYDKHLGPLWDHFHRNPELSLMEHKTAARLAEELRGAGFKVSEGIGGTGIVAMMENGPGPLVMVRGDMDGLPVKELSGTDFVSNPIEEDAIVPVEEEQPAESDPPKVGALGIAAMSVAGAVLVATVVAIQRKRIRADATDAPDPPVDEV